MFQSYLWNKTWLDFFACEKTEPFLLGCYQDGELVAIAPFCRIWVDLPCSRRQIRQICFIGNRQFDYLDFIFLEKMGVKAISNILLWLSQNAGEWDLLSLSHIRYGLETYESLLTACTEFGWQLDMEYEKSLQIALDGSFDEYIHSLSGRTRSGYRQRKTKIDRAKTFHIEKAEAKHMDKLIELHTNKWNSVGQAGVFDSDNIRNFHKAIAEKQKDILDLCFLLDGNIPVSGTCCYDFKGTRYYYLTGMKPEYKTYSPGIVLLLDRVSNAIQQGLNCFDLLRGQEEYKINYSNRERYICSLTISRKDDSSELIMKAEKNYQEKLAQYLIISRFSPKGFQEKKSMQFRKQKMRILFVAPHYDDEIIGGGGILAKHQQREDNCDILYLTDGSAANINRIPPWELQKIRAKEAQAALDTLGRLNIYSMGFPDGMLADKREYAARIKRSINLNQYDRIYLPALQDGQKDHSAAYKLIQKIMPSGFIGEVYLYEVLYPLVTPNTYFVLEDLAEVKYTALSQYKSQLSLTNYAELSRKINRLRGKEVGELYAEVFEKMQPQEFRRK